MPNCLTLTKKDAEEPLNFSKIDTELWLHFMGSEPKDNKKWYYEWYNIIGLGLAGGMSFEEIRKHTMDPHIKEITIFLEDNYTSNAWYSPK